MFRASVVFRSVPFFSKGLLLTIPAFFPLLRKMSLSSLPSFSQQQSSIINKIGYIRSLGISDINFIRPDVQPVTPHDPLAPLEEIETDDKTLHMDSVLRKRRLKMKKHKLRKRRRSQRSLKKRLGKL